MKIIQKVFLWILLTFIVVFGIESFGEFLANHTYYATMFGDWTNWKLIIGALLSAAIPTLYLLYHKTFSLKKFVIYTGIGLILFALIHTSVKDTILGGGFLIFLFNNILLFALGCSFILGILGLGTWFSNRVIKFKQLRIQELFMNFGIGLGVFLLTLYILLALGILHPLISWVIFIALGIFAWLSKETFTHYKTIISDLLSKFHLSVLKTHRSYRVLLALVVFSLLYYYYGFQLSFIPYSTAWDANHEYMYQPKVLAENFGVLRGNRGGAAMAPYLWHTFITFWFSLFSFTRNTGWLAPETFAVAMNFLSGLFCLFFGLGLVNEAINYFKHKIKGLSISTFIKNISLGSGWAFLLLWLSSGMGAFLVFVDNKTDLGVMAMTILALLSGFIVLSQTANEGYDKKEALKYVISSGFFFALASMAKPTAFLDIALFGLLLVGIRIRGLVGVGLGVMLFGLMGILQPGNAADFMGPALGKWIVLIGLIITGLGILKMIFQKKNTTFWQEKRKFISYIIIWGISFLAILTLFKGPALFYGQIANGSFTVSGWARGLLLGKTEQKVLLVTTADVQTIAEQTAIDQAALAAVPLSLEQCKVTTYTSEELSGGLRKAVAGNEDVGRYVGYGWKEFTKPSGLKLGYYLMRLFTPKNDTCYSLRKDAKILCKNATAVESFDVNVLQKVLTQLPMKSEGYKILSGALSTFYLEQVGSNYDPNTYKDEITELKTYYQNNASRAEQGKLSVPYRYVVPLNIIYNRSLQNLSSYYTDIGFIRLFGFAFLIFGLIYALVKKERELIHLAVVSVIGRAIWWIIGGGILWYGIGLIMWTIITLVVFIKYLMQDSEEEKDNTLLLVFLGILGLWCLVQLFFNFIRISSQGASGPFIWYKANVGKVTEIDDTLQVKETVTYGYSWKDVFDLQFPHYNKFIDAVKNRDDADGVLIAGTYMQYFLHNQHNLINDGMLGWFWEKTSDNDSCKSYLRLKDEKLKYLVIDPNIATVVMGEGNQSLFDRFFAKRDAVSGKIQEHGAITMLVKMYKEGYLDLFYSNNLGAKYAFTLPDETFISAFGPMSEDDLLYLRAKIAVARFFPDANTLVGFIADVFTQRIGNGLAIGDVADIYGKTVDENKLLTLASMYLGGDSNPVTLQEQIGTLTQDERLILAQYLGLYNLVASSTQEYQNNLQQLMGQSLGGSSQLIIFTLP